MNAHAEVENVTKVNSTPKLKGASTIQINDNLELVLRSFQPCGLAVKDKLYDFLRRHHLDSAELKYLPADTSLWNFSDSHEMLLKTAWKESSQHDMRGAALYGLTNVYDKAANFSATLERLNITAKEYIDISFPEMSDIQKSSLAHLQRWSPTKWKELREQARQYCDQLSADYSKVQLQKLGGIDDKIIVTSAGRIGKKAKSMSLGMDNASVGQPIGQLKVDDINGNTINLSEYAGKVIIVYFWSTNCNPCIKSIPYYRDLVEKSKVNNRALEFIAINIDRDRKDMDDFMKVHAMPFTHCHLGSKNQLLYDWDIEGFPTCVVISPSGIVNAKGALKKQLLEKAIECEAA